MANENMDTTNRERNTKVSDQAGNILGWLGVVLACVGFFYMPYLLGAAAIILGVIGLFSPHTLLASASVIIGALAMFAQYMR